MKTALCIGINSYGNGADLAGCVPDAQAWTAWLAGQGYRVTTLIEAQAVKHIILNEIAALVASLGQGEVGAVTYSGHGTWVPDESGDEPDGRDEALVPYNAQDETGLILDDDLADLFSRRASGAKIVFISDSCHSGSVFRFSGFGLSRKRLRFLPPGNFLPMNRMAYTRAAGMTMVPRNKSVAGVIHYSACRDYEYAADAEFDGKPFGALSHFMLDALKAFQPGITTYGDVYRSVRQQLPNWDMPQTPQLNASAATKKLPFLT